MELSVTLVNVLQQLNNVAKNSILHVEGVLDLPLTHTKFEMFPVIVFYKDVLCGI